MQFAWWVARLIVFAALLILSTFCLGARVSAQSVNLRGPLATPDAGNLKPPITLHQGVEETVISHPLYLKSAVDYAGQNYPSILKSQAALRAAKQNITVQKINEYLPDSLFQYQEIMSSHNKLSQVFYGSPVFPAVAGPGFDSVSMQPIFFSAAGASVDWAPIDFGLHKARIDLAKSQFDQTGAQYATTRLEVAVAAASAYLDLLVTMQQLTAAEQNLQSFQKFATVVHAQVDASLKPGADASLAEAQLAAAKNDLIRANLAFELAQANLASALGLGGKTVQINPIGLVQNNEPEDLQKVPPIYDDVPILKASRAALLSARAQKKVLDKEYFPVFHFLAGINTRGSGLSPESKRWSKDASGVFPVVPNYQVAMIINWNFLDIVRLKAEKKVQLERIQQHTQDYNLVLQNLQTQDLQSRARVKAAISLAQNMPVQVASALMAANQAEARYKTGLGSVAQVAEANQVLAQSRAQEAIARVGVWRALLGVAAVHGDLSPFLAEADRIQRGLK